MLRVFGVAGDPVAHSLSPAIHGLWIGQAGIEAVYLPFHIRSSPTTIDDIAALGRCGVSGINVTVPHKYAAFKASVSADQTAQDIGAANTLMADDQGRWSCYNTDVDGFYSSMASWFGSGWQDMPTSVLLIGAGGAARAVAYGLDRSGYELTIANRDLRRAEDLADQLAPDARLCSIDDIQTEASQANIVINATSIGHRGEEFFDIGHGQGRMFFDLSYGVASRSVLGCMESRGWRVMDGLQMLVAQAARSFHIWFGIQPDQQAAFRLCRELVAQAKE